MANIKVEVEKPKKWKKRPAYRKKTANNGRYPKLNPHNKKRLDDSCKVCEHDDRVYLEEQYLGRQPVLDLLKKAKLPTSQWYRHIRGFGLEEERTKNTMAVYTSFVDKGLEALENGDVDPNVQAKLGLDASKHIDRLEGRIIDRHHVKSEKQLVIQAFPAPGVPDLPKMLAPEKQKLGAWDDMSPEERQDELDNEVIPTEMPDVAVIIENDG